MGWLIAALTALLLAFFTDAGMRSAFELIAFIFGLIAVRSRIRSQSKDQPHSIEEY